jgi:hypothetical protein
MHLCTPGGPQSRSGIFVEENNHLLWPGIEARNIEPGYALDTCEFLVAINKMSKGERPLLSHRIIVNGP